MQTRWLVLALLLAPMLLLGAQGLRQAAGTERLLPPFDPAAVSRIEIARGREQVVLARRMDTGQWEIPSAADAPGDAVRIRAALGRLQQVEGQPLPAGTAPDAREPLEIRLLGADGRELGQAGFWTAQAQRRPDGPRLQIAAAPALPLWPSAWSSLAAPRIAVAQIAQVERVTPEGPVVLDTEAAVAVAKLLEVLVARDFVAGSSVNWVGAAHLRVRMADGSAIDLQQVPDGDGRFHLRLASESDTAIRAARRFAFRVSEPLP
jgi:hypothetical protein